MTPLEKLLPFDQPKQHLRQGRTLTALKRVARTLFDTEAVLRPLRLISGLDNAAIFC